MKFRLNAIAALILSGALFGCGGGGGSSTASSSSSSTFTAAATAGELLTYSVDTTNLTYSYEITASAYGKNGVRGSGTLTRNADGTYTPSGINGLIRINANGTMIGVINEDFNGDGTREAVPVFGVSNPITTAAEAAGTYNFVEYTCIGAACAAYYGTYKVNANGTWSSCNAGDLSSDSPGCNGTASGTVNPLGGGKFQIIDSTTTAIGTLVAHKDTSRNQKVMFLDLADTRTSGTTFGRGILVGSEKVAFNSREADGTWVYVNSRSGPGIVQVTGDTYTDTGGSGNIPLAANAPWTGFATTHANQSGYKVIMAGTGMFASAYTLNNRPQISIGLKLN